MNIIETAKAILSGSDIDPMVIVRAVARLEPVGCANNSELMKLRSAKYARCNIWPMSGHCELTEAKLYTLEADK